MMAFLQADIVFSPKNPNRGIEQGKLAACLLNNNRFFAHLCVNYLPLVIHCVYFQSVPLIEVKQANRTLA
jgi:hypothetical protein